jgi:two-component system NtrC family sensor kinase
MKCWKKLGAVFCPKCCKDSEDELCKANARLQSIAEMCADVIYSINADGIIEYVSAACVPVFGVPARAMIGRKWLEFVEVVDPAAVEASRQSALRAVSFYTCLYRVRRPDGSGADAEARAVPVIDGGVVVGEQGILRDISDRTRAEKALRSHERYFKDIVSAFPIPFFVKDVRGVYRFFNPSFAEYIGLPPEKIMGATVYDIAPKDLAEIYFRKDEVLFRAPGEQTYEARVRARNGEIRDVIFFKKTYFDEQGNVAGLIGTILDITDRKKVEEDLRQAHLQIRQTQDQMVHAEKLAAIGLLAAGVAHEINNPLAYIGSNMVVFERYVNDLTVFFKQYFTNCPPEIDETVRDMQAIVKESTAGIDSIKKIVQDLRTFSRADTGEWAPADLNEILDGILRIVWNEIKYKAELKHERGDLPMLRVNSRQLGQVFLNILVNAVQSIAERGVITVRTFTRPGEAVVEISDTGKGIPPEIVRRIFDPFFTTKVPGQGTGLGLSVSYDIIKKHGGRIDVSSEAGKGSRFAVILPLP